MEILAQAPLMIKAPSPLEPDTLYFESAFENYAVRPRIPFTMIQKLVPPGYKPNIEGAYMFYFHFTESRIITVVIYSTVYLIIFQWLSNQNQNPAWQR